VASISCGDDTTFFLYTDYNASSFGYNQFGQLGLGDITHRDTPQSFGGGIMGIDEIETGWRSSCYTTTAGAVRCIGSNHALGLGGTGTLEFVNVTGLPGTHAPTALLTFSPTALPSVFPTNHPTRLPTSLHPILPTPLPSMSPTMSSTPVDNSALIAGGAAAGGLIGVTILVFALILLWSRRPLTGPMHKSLFFFHTPKVGFVKLYLCLLLTCCFKADCVGEVAVLYNLAKKKFPNEYVFRDADSSFALSRLIQEGWLYFVRTYPLDS
jgi:hypothetical protein